MRRWSNSQMRDLGKQIAQSSDPGREVAEYRVLLQWHNELALNCQRRIEALDWVPLLGSRPFVTSRAKSADTLREKLLRDPATPLQSIQDIAGVRIEAQMALSQQDAVAETIALVFGHDSRALHDIRLRPHSGYRAVHVWLKLDAGRVEVQVRTALQGAWANLYEALADRLGRGIRYGEVPRDERAAKLVQAVHALSLEDIAKLEADIDERLLAEIHLDDLRRAIPGAPPLADPIAEQSRINEVAQAQRATHDSFLERLVEMKHRIETLRMGT